jgi:hypothetical protein
MPQCVAIDGSGYMVAASAPCTTAVVLSPTEYSLWLNSPLNLSLEDGVVIAGGIVGCWAAAFAWRAAIRALNSDDANEVET